MKYDRDRDHWLVTFIVVYPDNPPFTASVRLRATGDVLLDLDGRRSGLHESEMPTGDAALDARLEWLAEQQVAVMLDTEAALGRAVA